METKILDDNSLMDSSAAATTNTRYSAKELGEIMNTHAEELFNVDIAACTDWYRNDDFMEEMMSYVVEEENINNLIEFIRIMQEFQTTSQHHPKVCYRVPDERKYVPYVEDLNEKLCAMRVRVLHAREIEARLEEMKKRWSTTTTCQSSLVAHPAKPLLFEKSETQPPSYTDDSTDNTIEYHLADLPQDVRNQTLIDEDEKYSLFVNDLRGPVLAWIEKRRKQDWNVVSLNNS